MSPDDNRDFKKENEELYKCYLGMSKSTYKLFLFYLLFIN